MFDSYDFVNALFGIGVAAAISASIREALMEGQVRGVSVWTPVFFACMGLWNVLYYFHLQQWLSTGLAVVVFSVEAVWVLLVLTMSNHDAAG